MLEANKDTNNQEENKQQLNLPYKHCLNCGAELKGVYCHVCGQEVTDKTITVSGFIIEYINNAYNWDSKFLKTIWTLIRRPGCLTNEFLSGKIISQEHPLKLNMFLLFVFITLFVFFAGTEKMTDTVHSITNDERVFPGVQLNLLKNDKNYAKKMYSCPRDTVYLRAPLILTEEYPEIIRKIEVKEDTEGKALDKWIAIIPRVLITDEYVVSDDNGYYRFNTETKVGKRELEQTISVLTEMINITSQYFPILLLLTTPFLALSLSLVQRKSKLPRINHFIFALHYTAFLEFLMICIYILYLSLSPSMNLLELVMIIGACVYLTIAFRRVYVQNSWKKAIVKSLLTSIFYFFILLLIFIVIFFIACFIIASEYE